MVRAMQHGTIGELWQGPYQSSDGTLHVAIVTLPCARYVSEVTIEYGIYGQVPPYKSALAIERFISYFGIKSVASNYSWSLRSNIPHSVGMASSTADIVATIYALASLHKVQLSVDHIQDILRGIERSDPVFHQSPGLYLSKDQRFVRSWKWQPNFNVVYSILPGVTATESVNELDLLAFYQDNLSEYQASLALIDAGFQAANPSLIGTAATECAGIFQRFCSVQLVDDLINMAPRVNALGVVRAYTGHVAGLLFSDENESYAQYLPVIRNLFDKYDLPTLVDRAGYGT